MSAVDAVIKQINLHTSTDVLFSAGSVKFYIKKNVNACLSTSINTPLYIKCKKNAFMFMCLYVSGCKQAPCANQQLENNPGGFLEARNMTVLTNEQVAASKQDRLDEFNFPLA